MNSYAMKPLPLFESRSHAKYSQSWFGAAVSRSVSSHARRRSTWAFGFVRPSVGTASLWMTPILVVLELSGPSSLVLPKMSGSSVVPLSGMAPSMVNGPSAARAVIGTAMAPATTTAIASSTALLCRMRVRLLAFSLTSGSPLSPG